MCRKYDSGNCRFENGCAYKHLKSKPSEDHLQLKERFEVLEKVVQTIAKTNKDNEQLKEKVEVMEKVVKAMTRKVLCLESELKEVKKNKSHCYVAEDPKNEWSEDVKEKKSETEKLTSGENLSFNHNDIKGTASTPKKRKTNLRSLIPKLKC